MNKFESKKPDSIPLSPEHRKESRHGNPLLETKRSNRAESITRNSDQKTPEELKQIKDARRKIHEMVKNQQSQQERPSGPQNPTETVIIKNKLYTVEYVPKETIYPAFGYGGGDRAGVRQDLPPRVRKFVKAHELYHCTDQASWGGTLGSELRANLIPGLRDPVGLLATVWATITSVDRLKLYLDRITRGF